MTGRRIPPKKSNVGYGFEGLAAVFHGYKPLHLDCGYSLESCSVCYTTHGRLNKEKTNAVLVCHALTGDQFVGEDHPITQKPGWWSRIVGPGKIIDTNRFFVICSNVLGGCMGTTGPSDTNPGTGKPWGGSFPVVTIRDMVKAQRMLIDHLGIDQLFCAIGGSMGGMQVLQWLSTFPQKVFSAVAIACAARLSAQNIAFNTVSRLAIMADPEWRSGNYLIEGAFPKRGFSLARQIAHITYHSDTVLQERFGRSLKSREDFAYSLASEFQIESYLDHQGSAFVDRFDPNSYIYITKAMDYYDLARDHGGYLHHAFAHSNARVAVISFSSDWLFPTKESELIVQALQRAGVRTYFKEVISDHGHDAFLLDEPAMDTVLDEFLRTEADSRHI